MACISFAPEPEGQIVQRSELRVVVDFDGEKIRPTIRPDMRQEEYETAGAPFPKHMPRILLMRENSRQVLCDCGRQIRLVRRDPLVDLLLKFRNEQLGPDDFKREIEEMIMEQFSYILDESWNRVFSHRSLNSIKEAYLQSESLGKVAEFLREHLYGDSSDPKLTVHKFEAPVGEEGVLTTRIIDEFGYPDFEEWGNFFPGVRVPQRPE